MEDGNVQGCNGDQPQLPGRCKTAKAKLGDLYALLAVAWERSFTKAVAKLGVSPSALSQTVRELEARLKLRLLTCTIRSVSLTQAGERLLSAIGPRLEEIDAELAALSKFREKPSGTIRISATENAASSVPMPVLARLLPDYLDIKMAIIVNYSLTDIAAEQFDAGVRPGKTFARGMIAAPISPPIRMAVVGSPAHLEQRPQPRRPQDITAHNCINLMPAYPWRAVQLGVREEQAGDQGQGQGAVRVQQHDADAERGAGWPGLALPA